MDCLNFFSLPRRGLIRLPTHPSPIVRPQRPRTRLRLGTGAKSKNITRFFPRPFLKKKDPQRNGRLGYFTVYKIEPQSIAKINFFVKNVQRLLKISVADPDPNPDPPDQHVLGSPGSGSISLRYGSGSGSFYHQAKIVRKTLIPIALWLIFDFLSLKIM